MRFRMQLILRRDAFVALRLLQFVVVYPELEKGITTGDDKQNKRIRVIRRGRNEQEREFEQLYLQSYGLVYGYVRARMVDDPAVEDIVAEAYLKAARAFDRFDPARSKFSTWVVTIAHNCMVSHYRKAHPVTTLDDVPESLVADDGGQRHVEDRDLALRLLSVLDTDERELVLMKYRDDKRNVDIAAELGMNASTVATKLSNAIAKMRRAGERGA